jgi:glycosyltransferase involved in cell wall biosynthesis
MASTRPLSIAMMLESDGPGGAEVIMLQLSEELRRRGHTIHYVGPDRGEGWLAERYREKGFSTATYSQRRALDPRCLAGIVGTLRRLRVDLVHSHEFTMSIYGTAAASLLRKPHVTTMHGNEKMTRAWRRRAALRWAFRNSHAAVAVSRATQVQLNEDLGLPQGLLQMVPNGIPVRPGDPEKLRRELGMREGERLVLAVGSLIKRKGHITLLEALKRLDDEAFGVPWRAAIAGRGEEREKLLAYARESGLEGRLHLLGVRNDAPDVHAAADVFVMPSLWEGLPLAVLESMLAGKAIIATSASGIPEAITSGVHGVLIPPGDPAVLAGELKRLLSDSAERARLGEAAKAHAEQTFTIGKMTDAYESIYRSAAR